LSADIGTRAPTFDPKFLKIAPIKCPWRLSAWSKNWTVKKPSSSAQIFNFSQKFFQNSSNLFILFT
jgi:hypothetical protein